MNNNPILLFTEGDPWGNPTGGQTTFAKHILTAFGPEFAVSSHCEDNSIPIGKWIIRPYKKYDILFFNRGDLKKSKNKKPIVPLRIKSYIYAKKYLAEIREKKFRGILLDSPEMLFAAYRYKWESICYRFAGVNNPVSNSRYLWARVLGEIFERQHIKTLKKIKTDVFIAAADQYAIAEFHHRTKNQLNTQNFYQFPTRVDTDTFFPMDTSECRKQLNIPLKEKVFVATGRLCWIKGWDLLMQAFTHIKKVLPKATLIFVGDGEDHQKIELMAQQLGIAKNVKVTGFVTQRDVNMYMNAADVCLVGSHREGWSLAMCEMIACGKPVVSTDVSGAKDMVKNGINGFIVPDRDPLKYADLAIKAMDLPDVVEESLLISKKYSINTLAQELSSLWPPLSHSNNRISTI